MSDLSTPLWQPAAEPLARPAVAAPASGAPLQLPLGPTALAHQRFCRVLDLAEARLARGDLPAAAALAKLATNQAFPATVGLFGSPRLERLLIDIGRQMSAPEGAAVPAVRGERRQVLHVLTYAKPIGGDSRYAWRWIELDGESRHSVALTSQQEVADTYEIPGELTRAVHASGGSVHTLGAPITDPLAQARQLRVLCQDADVVVLHLYPYDIVPMLALASGCDSTRVLLVNHSDHTFWVGAGVAHGIAHLRSQNDTFLAERRGLDVERRMLLPIPIPTPPPAMARREAKQALGLDPDGVLLLSIASPFKYSAPGQVGLLDLVTPVLARQPHAHFIAVGPSDDGDWHAASLATGGRVQAMGRRWDNDVLFAAADIYLDSVPFSSITSLLEAGCHALALLGYRGLDEDMRLLGPGAPGIDDTMEMANVPAAYQTALERLIEDAVLRRARGERARQRIDELHRGDGWRSALAGVYAQLAATPQRGCVGTQGDAAQSTSLDEALARLFSSVTDRHRSARLVRHCLAPLPYASRLRLAVQLGALGFESNALTCLPPPLDDWARRLKRRLDRSDPPPAHPQDRA
jgi:hypothetical protein